LIHDSTRCSNDHQFIALVSTLKILLPFDFAAAMLIKGHGSAEPESMTAVNISFPNEYLNEYMARGYERIDPIIRDNMASAGLHYWGDSFDRYGRPRALFDLGNDFGFRNAAKGFGYAYGLANCSATERGLISFYGLKRSHRTETILSLVVPCLQEAMKRIRKSTAGAPLLTPREKEILQWSAAGKSSWDVSQILNLSERTVKYHIDRIMTKLDAANRTHAVAIALRKKMITLG
jgi:LuxR family quorum sensing-dependent transcriptional regulator